MTKDSFIKNVQCTLVMTLSIKYCHSSTVHAKNAIKKIKLQTDSSVENASTYGREMELNCFVELTYYTQDVNL